MSVVLNHTIVYASKPRMSAEFWARILGRSEPYNVWGMFDVLDFDNGVSIFFGSTPNQVSAQHYAFLVSEAEFESAFGRIKAEGVKHFGDPFRNQPGHVNYDDGGRGVYFDDPDGHYVELITRPYGILDRAARVSNVSTAV